MSVSVCPSAAYFNKYQLSLRNPRDALRPGERAANKGGRSV